MKKYTIGFCRECFNEIYNTDELLPKFENVYQCSTCGHPHAKDEILPFDEEDEEL